MGVLDFLKKKKEETDSGPELPKIPMPDSPDVPDIKLDMPPLPGKIDAPPMPGQPRNPAPMRMPEPKMPEFEEPPKLDEPELEDLTDESKVDPQALKDSMDDFFSSTQGFEPQPQKSDFGEDSFPLPKEEPQMPPLEPLSKEPADDFKLDMDEFEEPVPAYEPQPQKIEPEPPIQRFEHRPEPSIESKPHPVSQAAIPSDLPRQMINNSVYVNVAVFRKAAQVINNLSEQARVSEETLLRIRDITQNKDRVYEKWLHELEGIEKDMIHLDKMLFNV